MVEIEFNNFSLNVGNKRLFHRLSFRLEKGDRLLIKGPSGVGKSLLIKSILGFVPFKGTIAIKGEVLTPKNVNKLRLNIAYVPQNTDVFSGKLKSNLEEIFSAKANRRVNFSLHNFLNLLERFGFEPKGEQILEKQWNEFSGGERQRILIAIAYSLKRDIIVLDEPTSALDEKLKQRVISFFNSIDKTLIIVSHEKEWENLEGLQKLIYRGGKWILMR